MSSIKHFREIFSLFSSSSDEFAEEMMDGK